MIICLLNFLLYFWTNFIITIFLMKNIFITDLKCIIIYILNSLWVIVALCSFKIVCICAYRSVCAFSLIRLGLKRCSFLFFSETTTSWIFWFYIFLVIFNSSSNIYKIFHKLFSVGHLKLYIVECLVSLYFIHYYAWNYFSFRFIANNISDYTN